jgi:hypothetical protein
VTVSAKAGSEGAASPLHPLRPLGGHSFAPPEIDPMSQRRFPPPWSVEEHPKRNLI